MKKFFDSLKDKKNLIKILLSSGKELTFNLRVYSIDTDSYDDAVVFSFLQEDETYLVRYAAIAVVSYADKQFVY